MARHMNSAIIRNAYNYTQWEWCHASQSQGSDVSSHWLAYEYFIQLDEELWQRGKVCDFLLLKESSKSRREAGDHLARYLHFMDEETKAQRIQSPFLRPPNYLGSQSKLKPTKTNNLLNRTYFWNVAVVLASYTGYVFIFPTRAQLLGKGVGLLHC